jgi:hypothetical protein
VVCIYSENCDFIIQLKSYNVGITLDDTRHLCGNIWRREMANVPAAISTGFLPAGTVKGRGKKAPEYPVTPA